MLVEFAKIVVKSATLIQGFAERLVCFAVQTIALFETMAVSYRPGLAVKTGGSS